MRTNRCIETVFIGTLFIGRPITDIYYCYVTMCYVAASRY